MKRFVSLYFPHLQADWMLRKDNTLAQVPFVLTITQYGKQIISASNNIAAAYGNLLGMNLGDARAFIPGLKDFEEKPGLCSKLLHSLARWCGRFSPAVALDLPDGLVLDTTGCSHLWGSEENYLAELHRRLFQTGYQARLGLASTQLAAWATCRFGSSPLIPAGQDFQVISALPPAALKLEHSTLERCSKLGLDRIEHFVNIHKSALRRRFGEDLVWKLEILSGKRLEPFLPVFFPEPYEERLSSLEPIRTAVGIEIAIDRLLVGLCKRLAAEQKGLRSAILKCFRIDGREIQTSIGTHAPCNDAIHLARLLKNKVNEIEPGLGIEVFLLQAPATEELRDGQEKFWATEKCGLQNNGLASLMDRLESKLGKNHLFRYIPEAKYWPEHAFRIARTLQEEPQTAWFKPRQRPLQLFEKPEPVQVSAPVPDYPPMLFIYRGKVHHISKSDGPERICSPWWEQDTQARDYFIVEDKAGARFWIYREGVYGEGSKPVWYLHGLFS